MDGQQVTGARLNNHVAGATITPGFISGKTESTPIQAADSIPYFSSAGGDIRRITSAHLTTSLINQYYKYTTVGNVNYTILATDRVVATSVAITTTRTWTLPSASSVGAGQSILCTDMAAVCGPIKYIDIVTGAGDFFGPQPTVPGVLNDGSLVPDVLTHFILNRQGASVILTSDGVSKWVATVPMPKLAVNNSYGVNQTIGASDVYLAGSGCVIPAGYWTAKSTYRCRFDMLKTAGANPFVVNVLMGILGTTGDTVMVTRTYTAGTNVADTGIFNVWVTFLTVGAGTTARLIMETKCDHNVAGAGLTALGTGSVAIPDPFLSSLFDSTTQTNIGVSVNGGAGFAGVCWMVESDYYQP